MLTILLLTIFHIFFWLFFIFGGIFSKKICKINLYLILPLIYLIHIIPFHFILKKKIDEINNNYEYLTKQLDLSKVNRKDFEFMKQDNQFQKQLLGIKEDHKDNITKIYILEENKLILPMIQRRLRFLFLNSFADPLSAQGMVILGCIINLFLYNLYK